MEALVIGVLAGVIAIVVAGVVGWAWRLRRPSRLETKVDDLSQQIKELEEKVPHPPEYLDGLPEAANDTLRAAYREARVLQLEGYQAQNAERHREAVEQFTRALPLAETDSQRAALHLLRGNSLDSIGEWSAAMDDYQAGLRLSKDISPPEEADRARAAALGNLGIVYRQRGELNRAEEHCEEALEIFRRVDDALGQANLIGNLGNVCAERGDANEAIEHLKQALALHRRNKNPLGVANVLASLGSAHASSGDLDDAEHYCREALSVSQRLGYGIGEATALGNLGIVSSLRGNQDAAEHYYTRALQAFRRMDNPLGQANQLGNLGNVYRERGDLKRAEENYRKSLGIDRRIGHRLGEAIALRNLGLLAGEQGRAEEARGLLREALSLYERMGAGGEGPDKVRVSLRRLEEAGGQEKPRRARKRRSGSSDPDKPAGFEDPRLHVRSHDGSFHQ